MEPRNLSEIFHDEKPIACIAKNASSMFVYITYERILSLCVLIIHAIVSFNLIYWYYYLSQVFLSTQEDSFKASFIWLHCTKVPLTLKFSHWIYVWWFIKFYLFANFSFIHYRTRGYICFNWSSRTSVKFKWSLCYICRLSQVLIHY